MAKGKRAGSRRAEPPASTRKGAALNKATLAYAGGITLCVIAWGYLVYSAIDFGASARSGNTGAWALLILAGAGAVACLFVGLMLIARLSTALGLSRPPQDEDLPPDRPVGGRRASR